MEAVCSKKLIKSKSGLRIVVTNDKFRSPFLLCEPQWTPDSESTNCTACKVKFDFVTRRHHCRRCGLIYCGSCCESKMGLPRMCFVDPVRVCNRCAFVTNKESDFFDRQLKTLTSGATFLLDQRLSACPDSVNSLVCKLSQDHRYLVFEGRTADSVSSVELHQVKTLGVARDPDTADSEEELKGISSVEIVYTDGSQQNEQRVKLCSGPEPHRKLANAWIDAIQQVCCIQIAVRMSLR
ncbi:zinc finger FYVE domain-containing protein 21-like isoform X3 [Zootermopsis nevadensis]|uniref:zinc finger FYVE domain-containing protein 21-like isoform X3 n=1 Tax=Zootermopsis nevadensis TaxID=136037 RepID=UPI000B8E2455|nr:zinc finger FYVE domain-containing protein 21-like isoform X3 [Zootermopsis nevadensis]